MTKKLPNFVTQEEFEKMFKELKRLRNNTDKKRKKERYNQYMISILLGFEAGMRISEIVGLKSSQKYTYKKKDGVVINRTIYSDIPSLTKENVQSSSIRIIGGKGGKDRIVPRPKRLNNPAVNRLPLDISRRSLQDIVPKLGRDVLGRNITFHTLRHGFATHLVASGRPIHEIQILIGHARLDTTGIYLHANPTKAIEGAQDVF